MERGDLRSYRDSQELLKKCGAKNFLISPGVAYLMGMVYYTSENRRGALSHMDRKNYLNLEELDVWMSQLNP